MEDCTIQGTSPPTLEDIEKKLNDIKEAVNYEFKEADIDQVRMILNATWSWMYWMKILQMLQEKYRFRKSPYNYAMRKTQLMKERDMALLK